MKFSFAALASFAALTLAAPAKNAFVTVPLSRNPTPEKPKGLAFAADGGINIDLVNEAMQYNVDIHLGGQKVTVLVDTGSADLWVYSSNSQYCSDDRSLCNQYGSYDPSKSKTSHDTGVHWSIQYGIGEAAGDYYTDDASLGAANVTGFQFGVSTGSKSSGTTSVFGIGPQANEAAKDKYPNFPYLLKKQGVIKHNAYSMAFGLPGDHKTSEITFGAYNKGRFTGDLKTVPITTPAYQGHFGIKCDHAKIGGQTFVEGENVVLDSGTSLTYLTSPNYNTVIQQVQAAGVMLLDAGQGIKALSCSDVDKLNFEYVFSGKTIKVSGKDMTIPFTFLDANDNSGMCVFGIAESTGKIRDLNLFGDTFLRSIYSIYDLEQNQVSIAQAASGDDDFVEITGPLN